MHLIYMTASADRILFAAAAATPSDARRRLDTEAMALPPAMRQGFRRPTIVRFPWASPADGRMIVRAASNMLVADKAILDAPISMSHDFFMSWLTSSETLPPDRAMQEWIRTAAATLPHAPRAR